MRNNRKIIASLVAAAALAASGSLVYAQPQGPGAGDCAQGSCRHGQARATVRA